MIKCKVAFAGANYTQGLDVFPCCGIDSTSFVHTGDDGTIYSKINTDAIVSLRQSLLNDEWPEPCVLCEEAYNNNRSSMRTAWNDILSDYDIEYTPYITTESLLETSITLDSICNSRCLTCGPGASTSWVQELSEYSEDSEYASILAYSDNGTYFSKEYVDQFIEQCPNVKHLTLYGGEPTVSPNYIYLLNRLVESGRSKEIALNTTTNLTTITDEMMELWSQFKRASLNVSIDGIGKTNEYIRYPFKWEKVDRNLKRIIQAVKDRTVTSVGLSCTVSIFNILDCIELVNYWCDVTKDLDHGCGVNFNRVTGPEYARLEMASKEFRQQMIPRVLEVREKLADKAPMNAQVLDKLMDWMNEDQVVTAKQVSDLKILIDNSDRSRDRQIGDYIPDTYAEIQRLYDQHLIQIKQI